jgi:malate/lactate dehydrogenase
MTEDILREGAEEIAREWTTPMRLTHVLDHLKARGVDISGMESTKEVIREMTEDILREGAGEIVDSKEARAAIGKATARLLKQRLQEALKEA